MKDKHKTSASRPTNRRIDAELRALIERGRKRWRLLILAQALSMAVAALLAYLWLVLILDNAVHMSAWALVVANVAFFIGLIWLARRVLQHWRGSRFSADQVALAIEQRTPGGVENRLINAFQLSSGAAGAISSSTARALIQENYQFLKATRLRTSAGSRAVFLWAGAALLIAGAGIALWAGGPQRFTTSAQRLFMPLAGIAPVYRTHLAVKPGNVTIAAGRELVVRVKVTGQMPGYVRLWANGKRGPSSHRLPVDPETGTAHYTFPAVRDSMTYTLAGGDFRTAQFQVAVRRPLKLRELQADATYPVYTGLRQEHVRASTGDLKMLDGTKARLTFTFNQPVEKAWLVLGQAGGRTGDSSASFDPVKRLALTRVQPDQYATAYTFARSTSYIIEARGVGDRELKTSLGRLRASVDEPPQVRLSGIESKSKVMLQEVLDLQVDASDDYGLAQVGIFWRPVPDDAGGHAPSAASGGDDAKASIAEGQPWRPIQAWTLGEAQRARSFQNNHALLLTRLGLAVGDRLELAARARDNDPGKGERWTTGAVFRITATAPGAALQLIYQRILRTQRRIDDLIAEHRELDRNLSKWIAKLEADSGVDWGEAKNIAALAKAVDKMTRSQRDIRTAAGAAARDMPPVAGQSFPQTLGMLADTEMVRDIRILGQVAHQDARQGRHAKLADARLTVRRTVHSLTQLRSRYIQFRKDWELNHMISYTEMLALRQKRLADASRSYTKLSDQTLGASQIASISRQQSVVLELRGLAARAFKDMATRKEQVGPILTESFGKASQALDAAALKDQMTQAAKLLHDGHWSKAQPPQRAAADKLASIYRALRQAQANAAKAALERLTELAKTSEAAKEALEKLRAGSEKNTIAMAKDLKVEDTIRMVELAKQIQAAKEQQAALGQDHQRISYKPDLTWGTPTDPRTVDTSTHTLSSSLMSDQTNKIDQPPLPNKAKALVQKELEDVVGDLVAQAEELTNDYQTFQVTKSARVLDTGSAVARVMSNPINSTGATATTGNQPPPKADIGGVSRVGRFGGRSHGTVVGDQFVNRYGRKPQQGLGHVAHQDAPAMKETLSKHPQDKASTGTGGRRIDSRKAHYSTQNAGQWRKEQLEHMQAVQDVHRIVERQGAPMDPKSAAALRDLANRQEQLIKRIKRVKKKFDSLFLPTENLDKLAQQLQKNLDRLRKTPTATLFRQQVKLLNQLQASIIVVRRPSSKFVQSVRRKQQLNGRILDNNAAPAFPQYQDAVERYYRLLADVPTSPRRAGQGASP